MSISAPDHSLKATPRRAWFLARCWLMPLMLWVSCESPSPKPPIALSSELIWVKGGQAEAKAYLRALEAQEVFVTYQDSDEKWSATNSNMAVEVAVQASSRYASKAEPQRLLLAKRVALVLWDNLAPTVTDQVSIAFRDEKGRLVGDHLFSAESLRAASPQLHQ